MRWRNKMYLNDMEKAELSKLNDNSVLMNAVKKVLLNYIYNEGVLVPGADPGDPIKNFVLQKAAMALQVKETSNESLGEQLRADTQALRLVELGFQEIAKFKQIKSTEGKSKNPAR